MIRNDDEWQKYETIMGNVDRIVYLTRGLKSAVSIRRRCTVAAMALRGSAPSGQGKRQLKLVFPHAPHAVNVHRVKTSPPCQSRSNPTRIVLPRQPVTTNRKVGAWIHGSAQRL